MHVNFRPDEVELRDLAPEIEAGGDSSSKYADPEAEGVRPVLRTTVLQSATTHIVDWKDSIAPKNSRVPTNLPKLVWCPGAPFTFPEGAVRGSK